MLDRLQDPANPPQITLASASPRRQQLFQLLEIPHQVLVCEVDERAITAKTPREYALKTALTKACALDDQVPQGSLVVSADTIVVLDGETLLKPEDEEDAFRILSKIAGRVHHVISAIAVREVGKATALDSVTTEVKIRAATPEEIRDYIKTGEPMDKAGAYGIQGMGGRLVERITGDYFTVVGLPIDKLIEMLAPYVDTSPFARARRRLTPEIFSSLQ